MKRFNPINILRIYKINRSFGDTVFEALYYALRGKYFIAASEDTK